MVCTRQSPGTIWMFILRFFYSQLLLLYNVILMELQIVMVQAQVM